MIEISDALSRNRKKRELYGGDPYFRDAWDDLTRRWPDERARVDLLWRTGLVVFRPDAFASRRVAVALDRFAKMGLRPVAHTFFGYDRMKIREGWRYQLNIATRDRIDVMDKIMTAAPSLVVLYSTNARETELPVSVQLSETKGASLPSERRPSDLRFQLGRAQVSVLTFVHISDEPADLVRELGVFVGRRKRERLLDGLARGADATRAVTEAVTRHYDRHPASDILFDEALSRVKAACDLKLASELQRNELSSALDLAASGATADWRALLAQCQRFGLDVNVWDEIAIAAPLSTRHYVGIKPVIPDIGRTVWTETVSTKHASSEAAP